MLEWRPFSKAPEWLETGMLICLETPFGHRRVETLPVHLSLFLERIADDKVIGWMPAEEILNAPLGYDPTFGDNRLCLCGHPYYRHFDSYQDMAPVGCKYCGYRTEADMGIEYRKEVKGPEPPESAFGDKAWDEWWESTKPLRIYGLCSGFKWDGVECDVEY